MALQSVAKRSAPCIVHPLLLVENALGAARMQPWYPHGRLLLSKAWEAVQPSQVGSLASFTQLTVHPSFSRKSRKHAPGVFFLFFFIKVFFILFYTFLDHHSQPPCLGCLVKLIVVRGCDRGPFLWFPPQ